MFLIDNTNLYDNAGNEGGSNLVGFIVGSIVGILVLIIGNIIQYIFQTQIWFIEEINA